MLNVIRTGRAGGRALLIAHGLFGSARNWGVLSKRLGAGREVLAVDMRNHGASPWFDSNDYHDMAGDLAEVIRAEGAGPVDLLGHSMGGKAAMVLALTRPDLVARLVIADIAPAGYGHSQAHLIEAMQAVDLARISSRREADAALSGAVPEASLRAFLLQSLDPSATPPRWRLNLPVLRDYMPEIIGFPELEGRFAGPALFLTGGESDYVRAEHHARIRALFPGASLESIDGAGHWLHAEKPREFEAALRRFLESGRPGAGS